MLKQPKLARYDQHIELPGVGIAGQVKLFNASILIVGAGALGCPAALYLSAAGVGRIGLIDGDKIELTNLHRQILYNNDDIGHQKVLVAEKVLKKHLHDQYIETYDFFLDADNAEKIIAQYDIVLDATDNHLVRLLINETCLKKNKPWIYGAIYRFEGQTMLFGAKKGPCFSCIFPNLNESSTLPTCKTSGVLGPVAGVIGSLQALEALKVILDMNAVGEPRLKLIDLLTYEIKSFMVQRNFECRVCREYA